MGALFGVHFTCISWFQRSFGDYCFIFMAKLRPTLKAANPDWSTTEISSECGRQWKEMGDAERRPYVEQSKREKKISDRKIEEYKKTLGEQQSVKN